MKRAALLLLLAACPKDPTTGPACWENAAPEDFALPAAALLPDGGKNVAKKLEALNAEECGDSDNANLSAAVWRSKCNAALELVATGHCTPQIDAWCAARCTTDEGRLACLQPQRAVVNAHCVRGAASGLQAAMPFCAGLEIGPNHTFELGDAGRPACP
jgi:hypothetical protein